MNNRVTGKRLQALLDEDNHRFIIFPLLPGNKMDVPSIFRAIKDTTNTTWRAMADFSGLRNQSKAFRVAYVGNSKDLVKILSDYMVIDVDKNQAYFYHHEYKPAGVLPPHVGPAIKNAEAAKQTVTEKIPTKVTSRVTISDPLDRILTMSLTPNNGYLLGVRDVNLSNPGMEYVVTGAKKTLNRLLKSIHFVGVGVGQGNIIIKVDDNQGDVSSVSSTTISLQIEEGVKISVPKIVLPENPTAVLNKKSSFDPITVEDEDGKLMELRITPFGCHIVDFKNYLFALKPGEVRNIYGRPETINEDIEGLSIIPFQENAQIGIELICGNTKLREYLAFEVETGIDPEEPDHTDEPETGTTVSFGLTSPLTSAQNTQLPLTGFAFTGTRTYPFTVTVTPAGVDLTGLASDPSKTIAANEAYSFAGTLDEVNAEFANIKAIVGTTSGTVAVSYLGQSGTVTINVQVSPTEVEAGTTVAMTLPTLEPIEANGSVVLTGVAFTGTRTVPMTVSITPEGCSITNNSGGTPQTVNNGETATVTGTLAELTSILSALTMTVAEADGGVLFSFIGETELLSFTIAAKEPDPEP